MKKILVLCLLLGSLVYTQAQGVVRFSNMPSDLPSPPDRLVRFDPVTVGTNAPNPFGTNGAPVVGTNYVAQLFYGSLSATAESLVPVNAEPSPFRYFSTPPGTWNRPGLRFLDGFLPGETVNLQVRVWDSDFASSWEEYLTVRQGLAGQSLIFTYFIDNVSTFPSSENMFNFQGFYIGVAVPEPTSGALFNIGLFFFSIGRLGRRIL